MRTSISVARAPFVTHARRSHRHAPAGHGPTSQPPGALHRPRGPARPNARIQPSPSCVSRSGTGNNLRGHLRCDGCRLRATISGKVGTIVTSPQRLHPPRASALVDLDRGTISREAFVDKAIFDLELEDHFTRCWLLVGHESQISAAPRFLRLSDRCRLFDGLAGRRGEDSRIAKLVSAARHEGVSM